MKIYLTKKDLNRKEKVHGMDRYMPGDDSTKTLFIRTTSGTTGTPTVMIKKCDPDQYLYGQTDDTALLRVNHLHAIGLQFTEQNIIDKKSGPYTRTLYLNPEEIPDLHLEQVLKEFTPTFVHSTPSLFNHLVQTLRQKNILQLLVSSLKTLLLSGELAGKSLMRKLTDTFPDIAMYRSYGMAEFGMIGISCETLTRAAEETEISCTKVHPYDMFRYEILNPDEGGLGEVVITKPGLSRYRTGDVGKLEEGLCACGKNLTLTIFGRINYDHVTCLGATIILSHLEELFDELNAYVKDFLVEVREIHNGIESVGELTISVVPTDGRLPENLDTNFILNHIEKNLFVTKTRTLEMIIDNGIFIPSSIRVVDTFFSSGKKVRLRKVE